MTHRDEWEVARRDARRRGFFDEMRSRTPIKYHLGIVLAEYVNLRENIQHHPEWRENPALVTHWLLERYDQGWKKIFEEHGTHSDLYPAIGRSLLEKATHTEQVDERRIIHEAQTHNHLLVGTSVPLLPDDYERTVVAVDAPDALPYHFPDMPGMTVRAAAKTLADKFKVNAVVARIPPVVPNPFAVNNHALGYDQQPSDLRDRQPLNT